VCERETEIQRKGAREKGRDGWRENKRTSKSKREREREREGRGEIARQRQTERQTI